MDWFAALTATWPAAETVRLGPWTLRRGAGGGGRASAATLEGPLDGLDAAAAAMRAWGQRPLVMVRTGEDALDAALAAHGWSVHDPALLLAAPADAFAFAVTPEEAIDCDGPLACMSEIWAAGGIGPGRLAVMERAPQPKTWLLGRRGDRPSACAFVAAYGPIAMLHALEVAPQARRAGQGEMLTRAAAAWTRERGSATLALAVRASNAPARALYARLGFSEVASYRYRAAPSDAE